MLYKDIKCLLLHQRGGAATVVGGAEGWSDRAAPSELMLGGFDSPLYGSLSPERHEEGDVEDEAVLLWVILKC